MQRKINVAIFTFGFYTGGTERQLIELIKGLDRTRFNLHVAASRPGGQLNDDLERNGIPVEYFPIESMYSLNSMRQLWGLRSFLVRNNIDVLNTYSLIGNTFGVLAGLLARIPIIITSRRDMGVMVPRFYGPMQKGLTRCVDAIVTNADAIRKKVIEEENVRQEKVSVIYNGIDLDRFIFGRSCRAEVRRELGINQDDPVLGVIAEIKPVKGHIYLLEALKRMIRIRPELRLLVIGGSIDPAEKENMEARSREMGLDKNAIFLGRSLEVPRLLSAIDISVLPSLSEGVSNTILESMAAGVPVIATNVGGNPEIVIDGETGLIVPPANPEAIAEATFRLLDKPELASTLAWKAQSMVYDRFSNKKMVSSFENFYLKLTEEKMRSGGIRALTGLRRRLA